MVESPILYCDGGIDDGTPYISVAIERDDGTIERLVERESYPKYSTSNEAEHLAIQRTVEIIQDHDWDTAFIKSDSMLAVCQVKQEWQTRASNLLPIVKKTQSMVFDADADIVLEWVERKHIVQAVGH